MNWLNYCTGKNKNPKIFFEKVSIRAALNQTIKISRILVVNEKYVLTHKIVMHMMKLSTYYSSLYHCQSDTIGCKTQTDLIFSNIFKAASYSCYEIVAMKTLELLYSINSNYLIEIFIKSHNQSNKFLN